MCNLQERRPWAIYEQSPVVSGPVPSSPGKKNMCGAHEVTMGRVKPNRKHYILDALVSGHESINNLQGTRISIRLEPIMP